MQAGELPAFDRPTILCLQAGNVNTGASDPFEAICAKAREPEHRVWVHIDGAFGLWAAAAPARAGVVKGYAEADSWATDAHKWLNVPYDCGIALVRDIQTVPPAMAINASYLQPGERLEPLHLTPEASRRARGVPVWAVLKSLGRGGVAELVDRSCRQAARFAQGLRAAGYEVLNDVVLNQVLVSFGAPEQTLEVVRRIQQDGTCWCGSTVWQGRRAMRISVSDWATTDDDVELSLAAMVRIAGELRGETIRPPMS
jgi:glutamate/tyrosine decarboxylase-like PLP-dependent enzyme